MLFLLNDRVLDVTEEVERIRAELSVTRRAPSLFKAVSLGQQVIFAGHSFAEVHPSASDRVAALIAMASDANAALFVRPEAARGPEDVAVRLAAAPLTTLTRLEQYQREGAMTAALANAHVWRLASGASAA